MTCPSDTDDAAYVLGALSPRERLDFERHLADCPVCAAAVRDLAGLPGLLGRIDPAILEEQHRPDGPAVPDSLLDGLAREVRHRSRVDRWRWTASTAAAAVLVGVLGTTTVDALSGAPVGRDAEPPGASGATDPTPSVRARRMTPIGEVPVRASLALESVTWGTRLVLECTYDTDSVEDDLPPRVDYFLYLRTHDGRAERVGSWRSVDGETMSLVAGSATVRADIASVEVRAPGGLVVLELTV